MIPKPYYQDEHVTLYCGDCVATMKTMLDNSVDSIVTDPPYGLGFMGKGWDATVPGVEVWIECLRVLKPGGHLLAFAGTRTQHRMACAIEDAGFEIRDMIAWVYGSGFPKSLDVSKAIDKAAGAEREAVGKRVYAGGHVQNSSESIGFGGCDPEADSRTITAPATEAARQWQGLGTALKPSLETITMARKPLIGTVAANVMQYGTGGINVDGCRVGVGESIPGGGGLKGGANSRHEGWQRESHATGVATEPHTQGRWPANLIHDGSDEVLALFPESVSRTSAAVNRSNGVLKHGGENARPSHGTTERVTSNEGFDDAGSAARFFYTAKADSSERRQSKHPTVKPLDLIRYLVRMVTPEGGVVLDPFLGSGTLCEAARAEHCLSIGIELDAAYCADAVERLRQGVLF